MRARKKETPCTHHSLINSKEEAEEKLRMLGLCWTHTDYKGSDIVFFLYETTIAVWNPSYACLSLK